jgi:hypothetical protein
MPNFFASGVPEYPGIEKWTTVWERSIPCACAP